MENVPGVRLSCLVEAYDIGVFMFTSNDRRPPTVWALPAAPAHCAAQRQRLAG